MYIYIYLHIYIYIYKHAYIYYNTVYSVYIHNIMYDTPVSKHYQRTGAQPYHSCPTKRRLWPWDDLIIYKLLEIGDVYHIYIRIYTYICIYI
jgi:hypothetical protein